jgi:diguanylate cyclase (GGDEF)-like protein
VSPRFIAAALLVAAALPALAAPEATPDSGREPGVRCIETAVGDPQVALPMAAQGLADARARVDRKAEALFRRCEGYAREQLGQTSEAMASYDAAAAAAQLSGDDSVLAKALVSRGELRHFSGDYGEAISDLTRAYELIGPDGDPDDASYTLNAIANLYADSNVGEYDKAIDYYQQTFERHRKAGSRGEMATTLFNIGSTQERKGDFAAALAQYQRALEIDASLDNGEGTAEENRVIGGVLVKMGRAPEALPHVEKALAWFQGSNDPDGVARVRLTRGIALRGAGRAADALVDLDASRGYFLAEKNERFLVRIAEERAKAFADLQRWKEAYEALGEQFTAQREIDRRVAEERTARLRVQFGTEQTERQNTKLQQENQRRAAALQAAERERRLQNQVIVLGALLLALLAGLALRQILRSRRLHVLALTDELTGLPNRRNILAFLDEHAQAAKRSGQPLGVVSFDIDHFKKVNDVHGHDGGDRALRRIATVANTCLRDSDRLGRVGGEEFLLVLPNTEQATAVEIAERLRKAIEAAAFDEVAPGARMAVSLGVAAWDSGHDTTAVLMKRADEALYLAKEGGRNRVVAA